MKLSVMISILVTILSPTLGMADLPNNKKMLTHYLNVTPKQMMTLPNVQIENGKRTYDVFGMGVDLPVIRVVATGGNILSWSAWNESPDANPYCIIEIVLPGKTTGESIVKSISTESLQLDPAVSTGPSANTSYTIFYFNLSNHPTRTKAAPKPGVISLDCNANPKETSPLQYSKVLTLDTLQEIFGTHFDVELGSQFRFY